jgi:hypothetical protein
VTDRWFSLGTPFSSTNKTDCHDIAEILLKVALNTIPLITMLISCYNTDLIFILMTLLFFFKLVCVRFCMIIVSIVVFFFFVVLVLFYKKNNNTKKMYKG